MEFTFPFGCINQNRKTTRTIHPKKDELKVKAAATQGNQSRWFFGKSAQFSQVGALSMGGAR